MGFLPLESSNNYLQWFLDPIWGDFLKLTLFSKDQPIKVMSCFSFYPFSVLVWFSFSLVFFSFFDPPWSLFPYSSSSLAFVELTVEFSTIAGSCDRNSVHRLVYNIDLHPLLGAVEGLGNLWQLINTIDVAFEGFGTCM
jgi:hypothetical protein